MSGTLPTSTKQLSHPLLCWLYNQDQLVVVQGAGSKESFLVGWCQVATTSYWSAIGREEDFQSCFSRMK